LIGLRDGGLARLSAGTIHAVPIPDVHAGILAIVEDADGTLWLGTRGGGLVRLPVNGAASVLGRDEGLPDEVAAALLRAPEGFLWVGTRRGLSRLTWTDGRPQWLPEPGMPIVSVVDLALDRAGRLWAGTLDAGVLMRENGQWRQYGVAEGLASEVASRVRADPAGALWIGSVAGLQRWVDGRLDRPLGAAEGLTSDIVRSVQVDVEGNLWVGTDAGLDRFRDGLIYTVRPGLGPGEGGVRSVAVDRGGDLWIGTTNGLFRVSNGLDQRFDRRDGLTNESILAVAEDAQGVLWVGTQGGGIHTRVGERFVDHARELQAATGAPRGVPRALLKVRDGFLVGTEFGVLLLRDDGAREFYGKADGLQREVVLSLAEDADGRIWVGSRFGTMRMRRNPPGAARTFEVEALPVEFAFPTPVLGFAVLAPDRMLMATGRGLMVAQGEHVRALGDLKRTLFNIADDGAGHWWMCSNQGLFRIDHEDLQAAVDSAATAATALPFSLLDRRDGMPTSQCGGGSHPSSAYLPDGRIVFATSRGVAVVDASRKLAHNPRPPPVQFESAEIDFQPVALPQDGQPLVLSPGQRRIDLSYVGLSLIDPAAVRYRYRFDGEDADWVDAGDRRTAVLANLPPGAHRFRVIASNNSGVWNPEGAALNIRVIPHWTQQWWFRIGIAVVVLLGAVFGVRWRLNALARRAQELELLVQQKTAELAAQSARFEQLSRVDGLTQLANRREFDRVLAFAEATGQTLCLALGDVDHFKSINDRHSHVIGDEVLRTLAAILRAHAADGQLAVRFGGEELALVMPELDLGTARAQIEAIRHAIERHPWNALRPGLAVTISFGVAASTEVDHHADLIALADRRLYQSKAGGRNRVT
jgi:diguanylate cyclase (GGDEF)-like protein